MLWYNFSNFSHNIICINDSLRKLLLILLQILHIPYALLQFLQLFTNIKHVVIWSNPMKWINDFFRKLLLVLLEILDIPYAVLQFLLQFFAYIKNVVICSNTMKWIKDFFRKLLLIFRTLPEFAIDFPHPSVLLIARANAQTQWNESTISSGSCYWFY